MKSLQRNKPSAPPSPFTENPASAVPKLRGDAVIEFWPEERREKVLSWLRQGKSLREVSRLIRRHWKVSLHYTSIGRFYRRERRRRFEDVVAHSVGVAKHIDGTMQTREPQFNSAIQQVYELEFFRAYTNGCLSPAQVLHHARFLLLKRKRLARELEAKRKHELIANIGKALRAGLQATASATPPSQPFPSVEPQKRPIL